MYLCKMEFLLETLAGYQGVRLHTTFYPHSAPRGTIFWIHGYAEHQGRYREVITYLWRAGWQSVSWDLRGHGASGGERGFVSDVEEYLLDFTAVYTRYKEVATPHILIGHSLGGLVALRYRQKYPMVFSPALTVVSAPLIAFRIAIPRWKTYVANLAARIWPTLAMSSGLQASQLTHDPDEARAYTQDPMVFTTATAGWYYAVRKAQEKLWQMQSFTQGPLHGILPLADPVCDSVATQRFWEGLAVEKTLDTYADMFHEPFHEVGREKVFSDLQARLEKVRG